MKHHETPAAAHKNSFLLLVIPPSFVEQLRWNPGDELEPEVKDGKLIVKKK